MTKKHLILSGLSAKLNLLILSIAAVFLLTGCGNRQGGALVESSFYKEEYIPNEDYNYRSYNWLETSHGMVQTEDGYYFIAGEYLFFLDKDTGQTMPLCFKTDCLHNEETDDNKVAYCDALLGMDAGFMHFLAYSQGRLYTICVDRNTAGSNIIEMKPDGSDRKVLSSYPFPGSDDSSTIMLMHRGVIYYGGSMVNMDGERHYGLNAFSTVSDSEEPIQVYTGAYDKGWIQNVSAYQNYVFFKDCYNTDTSFSGKIMKYDIRTGESEAILEGDYTIYGMEEGNLLIRSDGRYYVYSLKDKELAPSKKNYDAFLDAHPLWQCHCENAGENLAMFTCYDKEVDDFVTDLYVVDAQGEVAAVIPYAAWSNGSYVFEDNGEIYYFRYSYGLSPFWIRGYSEKELMQGIVNPISVIEVEDYNDAFNNGYIINTGN